MANPFRTIRKSAEERPRIRCPKRDGTLSILDARGWQRQRLPTLLTESTSCSSLAVARSSARPG
jgi:hypothetical protein